ncbi:MAG: nucleotidyl transferase AbiEii/AbiGii toxin family protein [Verrucomicrobia bacterium]|nr:nucleotidyl transferase AbiEii/AbiGii toxin family protein [Verrucomicrobiota bacterium]
MNGLEELLRAAAALETVLRRCGWQFCFIGGVAVQRWGTPRFTQDIDLTLLTGCGEEEKFVDALLKELNPRRPDAREFALRNRVLLLQTRDGVDVDIALGALPFEERCVARASAWRTGDGTLLTTCSAEDLVVQKTFAGRGVDWSDVERVLTRQHGKLKLPQIRAELKPLLELKNEPESLDKLEGLLATVERRLKTKL